MIAHVHAYNLNTRLYVRVKGPCVYAELTETR